jgi:hypothetical protein
MPPISGVLSFKQLINRCWNPVQFRNCAATVNPSGKVRYSYKRVSRARAKNGVNIVFDALALTKETGVFLM